MKQSSSRGGTWRLAGNALTLAPDSASAAIDLVDPGADTGSFVRLGDGADRTRGGTGSCSLTLGDLVRVGNGDDRVSGGCGLVSLTRGDGQDRVAPGGSNSVMLGNGDDTIGGGLELVGRRAGDGCDRIRLAGGGDTLQPGRGTGTLLRAGDRVAGGGGRLALTLHGGDTPVTIAGGDIDIADDAFSLVWELAVLPVAAAPSGLRSDGAGGSLPELGDGGVLHVAGVAPVSLHDLLVVPGH